MNFEVVNSYRYLCYDNNTGQIVLRAGRYSGTGGIDQTGIAVNERA